MKRAYFKTSSVAIAFKEKIPNTYDVVLDRVMMNGKVGYVVAWRS